MLRLSDLAIVFPTVDGAFWSLNMARNTIVLHKGGSLSGAGLLVCRRAEKSLRK